jgi:hypothetical protein
MAALPWCDQEFEALVHRALSRAEEKSRREVVALLRFKGATSVESMLAFDLSRLLSLPRKPPYVAHLQRLRKLCSEARGGAPEPALPPCSPGSSAASSRSGTELSSDGTDSDALDRAES